MIAKSMTCITILVFSFTLMSIEVLANDWIRILNLSGSWKFSIGDDEKWARPSYDDSAWELIHVPSPWEEEGFHGYDGYAWYRKSFHGKIVQGNNNIYLFLGYIDDVDEVYVNGRLIGSSGSFPPKFSTAYKASRRYLIPAGYLNSTGNNTIAVRIYDTVNEGGIVSGNVGLYTRDADAQTYIDLRGIWSFSTGDNQSWKHRYWNDGDWENVMVPAPWETQGFKNYDGIAWYRKQLRISNALAEDELVLVLGKIDDFDEVYINGEMIGYTRDDKPYGSSSSYLKLRLYHIPPGLLKANQQNIIAVRVHDMGNIGGIYDGPIGLVKKSEIKSFINSN